MVSACKEMKATGLNQGTSGNVSLRNAKRFPGTAAAYWLGAGIRCARN